MSATAPWMSRLDQIRDAALIIPDDRRYDMARQVWNAQVNRRPAAVLKCETPDAVAKAITVCTQARVPFRIRGGGHSAAGLSIADDAIVIDLAPMRHVVVDAQHGVVHAGGGALWSDVDAATARHGLAVTGGAVSHTGIGGLILGGGIGWLTRRLGTSCDNLVAANVVLADGSLVHVDEHNDADLLWALRGGGANFGVVTTFTLKLAPIPTPCMAGLIVRPVDDFAECLQTLSSLAASMPRELGICVGLTHLGHHPAIPPALHGQMVTGAAIFDSSPTGTAWREPARLFGQSSPRCLLSTIKPIPYEIWQQSSDAESPHGRRNYWKSSYLQKLTPVETGILAEAPATLSSPHGHLEVHLLGGKHAEPPTGGTAYGHREAQYLVNTTACWDNPEEDDQHPQPVRELHANLQRTGNAESYANYLAGDEVDGGSSAAFDVVTRGRLEAVKQRVDPTDQFRGHARKVIDIPVGRFVR